MSTIELAKKQKKRNKPVDKRLPKNIIVTHVADIPILKVVILEEESVARATIFLATVYCFLAFSDCARAQTFSQPINPYNPPATIIDSNGKTWDLIPGSYKRRTNELSSPLETNWGEYIFFVSWAVYLHGWARVFHDGDYVVWELKYNKNTVAPPKTISVLNYQAKTVFLKIENSNYPNGFMTMTNTMVKQVVLEAYSVYTPFPGYSQQSSMGTITIYPECPVSEAAYSCRP